MIRAALVAVCLAVSACSTSEAPPSPAAAAPAAQTAPIGAAGSVTGRVRVTGAAVVVLEPKAARTFAPQSEEPVMDQVGLTFGPELLLVRTGEPVEFRNSDDTLHNVNVAHEETREQAFNVAIPTGNAYTHTFRRDGFYRVACDIHPEMSASIFAAATPYSTLVDRDGAFRFADVPAGAWTITVYADGARRRTDVEVAGGAVTNVRVE